MFSPYPHPSTFAYLANLNIISNFSFVLFCFEKQTQAAPKEKKTRKAKFAEMDPSEKVVEPNKVFVQNLTWETTEEELVAAFCPIADVTSVEIRQVCMRTKSISTISFNLLQHVSLLNV
jgi:RNA recognition motif-containing protein